MRRARQPIAIFLLASGMFVAPSVFAQDPPPAASLAETLQGPSKNHYDSGRLLYRDGDYAGARMKFQDAYDHSHDPRLLWNMAACEKNLRRYSHVLELIERYLTEGGPLLTTSDREEAKRLLDAIKPFVGRVTVSLNVPGARVFVDDRPVGTSPIDKPLLIDMGDRRIKVTKPGYDPFTKTETIPGGADTTMTISLIKEVRVGKLNVMADVQDTISINGKPSGVGQWTSELPVGTYRVQVSAYGKQTYDTQVVVTAKQTSTVRIKLDPIVRDRGEGGISTWLWVTSGIVLATGMGVGGYFLFKPEDKVTPTTPGTMAPGTVQVPLGR